MDLGAIVGVAFVIAFLMLLTSLPGVIAKKKGENFYYWWLASTLTGVIPGFIASIIHRKWQISAVKAFLLGIVSYGILGWALFGIIYIFSSN